MGKRKIRGTMNHYGSEGPDVNDALAILVSCGLGYKTAWSLIIQWFIVVIMIIYIVMWSIAYAFQLVMLIFGGGFNLYGKEGPRSASNPSCSGVVQNFSINVLGCFLIYQDMSLLLHFMPRLFAGFP